MVNSTELSPAEQMAGEVADFIFRMGGHTWKVITVSLLSLILDQIAVRLNDPKAYYSLLDEIILELRIRVIQ